MRPSQSNATGTNDATDVAIQKARALGKLLTFASLYPANHPFLASVAGLVLQPVKRRPTRLRIEIRGLEIAVMSQLMDTRDRDIGRLHGYLSALGVAQLDIEPDATPAELYFFATSMLDAKAELDRSSGFVRIDITRSMPRSVHVVQRAFGRRVADLGSPFENSKDPAVVALEEQATRKVTQAVREIVPAGKSDIAGKVIDHLVTRIVEKVGGKDEDSLRRLDRVLDLCAHAVRAGIEEIVWGKGTVEDLPSFFAAAHRAVSVADDPDAMRTMTDVLRMAERDNANEVAPRPKVEYQLSLMDLENALAEYARHAVSIREPGTDPHSESISILLHLALIDAKKIDVADLRRLLTSLRSGAWSEDATQVFQSGVCELLRVLEEDSADCLLPEMLGALRTRAPRMRTHVLMALCKAARDSNTQKLFWPHLVNELLVGTNKESRSDETHHYESLTRFVCEFTPSTATTDRLTRLDGFHQGRIHDYVLTLKRPKLFPVLALLLSSSLEKPLATAMLAALRNDPPQWVGSVLFAAIDAESPDLSRLLLALLDSGGRFQESRGLATVGGAILARTVAEAAEESRTEPWILNALHALGQIEEPSGEAVLRDVLGQRQWLRHVWPEPCRSAAKEALRMRKDRGRRREQERQRRRDERQRRQKQRRSKRQRTQS